MIFAPYIPHNLLKYIYLAVILNMLIFFSPRGYAADCICPTTAPWSDPNRPANVKADFGAMGNGVANDSCAIINAINSGAKYIQFSPGVYKIDCEIPINTSCILEGTGPVNQYSLEYPNNSTTDHGAVILVSHNNSGLGGFNVGAVNPNIQVTIRNLGFDAPPTSSSFAAILLQCTTAYLSDIYTSGNLNGLFVNNCYIGKVERSMFMGGAAYAIKQVGSNSLVWDTINLGSGAPSQALWQILTTGGHTLIRNIYLEGQNCANIHIFNNSGSTITIDGVYAENSKQYDIYADYASDVTIRNYLTNTAPNAILIYKSNNIRIDGISAQSPFYSNPVVNVVDSTGVYIEGIKYVPGLGYPSLSRSYVMIRGMFDGCPRVGMVKSFPLIEGSRTNLIPSDPRAIFSSNSIRVSPGGNVQSPFINWRPRRMAAITAIFKSSTLGPNDCYLLIRSGSSSVTILTCDSINSSVQENDFQVVTLITKLPDLPLTFDANTFLGFYNNSNADILLHYLSIHEYDGSSLPMGD
ncbi:glycosyl hydrolase family 28-related protein [Geothrix sp. 21YS21S-4]|uniref:glycosyl hydrolase family 28-related protein n=1 Tax=Geothrix sp. 21YS21S-4 TaxID=3068889 RepID=UPI0027B9A79C|nr:glycosyl hydrolase family 28-related protein [Geothrix sp. 21YS21S-4]